MLRRDDQESLQLDQHFQNILAKIRPYLSHPPSAKLCRLWLERLNRASDQPNLRNDYLGELYKQLKNGELSWPFDKPPENGRLLPISRCHRLATSSSCNELTETSFSLCEKKRSWPKPRSKSLRRDCQRRVKPLPRHFDVHSSSPTRTDNNASASSPTVHFYEPDNRNLLRTYRERIDTLTTIVEELETQNGKLKEKLVYYQNASSDVPHLHARIKQLMAELSNLKSKLMEVEEIKTILKRNHDAIVAEYKSKLKEQFNKFTCQMQKSRIENQELNAKIAEFEQKLEELDREKEEVIKSSDKDWVQKIDSMKSEYEKVLEEQKVEIRRRDEIVNQKETELAEKINEIEMLSEKIRELQQLVDMKSQDDDKILSVLVDQFKTIKNEISEVKNNIEISSRKQSESHQQEIIDLKNNVLKLEKFTQKLQQEYEKKINNIVKTKDKEMIKLREKFANSTSLQLSHKNCEIGDRMDSFESKYRELLDMVVAKADRKRHKYFEKISFLEDQMGRLENC